MNILKTLSDIKHSPKLASIRQYTNLLYYDPQKVILDLDVLDIVEVEGFKFKVTNQINSLQRIKRNPWFENIKTGDVAVDIGANIGAISIPLASICKKLYAIEPLYSEELQDNINLNNLKNIEIVERAIGIGKRSTRISFAGRTKEVKELSFNLLKSYIASKGDKIDFLKMDGEGCEWSIQPEELEGIRELRIEFHIKRNMESLCKRKLKAYLSWMNNSGYIVFLKSSKTLDPYDSYDFIVRASLEP